MGYYENEVFQEGAAEGAVKTGYAYEYYRKLSEYTGWKYEYIEGNWSELLQMLKDGRIDLMSDVSYAEERTEYMLYPDMPMGSEMYYLYVAPDNEEITVDSYASLNKSAHGGAAEFLALIKEMELDVRLGHKLLEVTPENFRIRKKILDSRLRLRENRKSQS